jgi:hypothetical protein
MDRQNQLKRQEYIVLIDKTIPKRLDQRYSPYNDTSPGWFTPGLARSRTKVALNYRFRENWSFAGS